MVKKSAKTDGKQAFWAPLSCRFSNGHLKSQLTTRSHPFEDICSYLRTLLDEQITKLMETVPQHLQDNEALESLGWELQIRIDGSYYNPTPSRDYIHGIEHSDVFDI